MIISGKAGKCMTHKQSDSNSLSTSSVPTATWRTRLANWAFSTRPADLVLKRRATHLVSMLKLASHISDGGVYVDIGSGTGHNTVRIAQMTKGLRARFICVEPVSKPTRRVLRRMASRTDGLVQFVRGIGNQLPVRNHQADGVSLFFVLHHIPYALQLEILAEIRRVLKPNGLIFLWEDTPENQREFIANEVWDRRLNFEPKQEPHYYRRADEWQQLWIEQGFELVDRVYYEDHSRRKCEGLIRHTGFVFRNGDGQAK